MAPTGQTINLAFFCTIENMFPGEFCSILRVSAAWKPSPTNLLARPARRNEIGFQRVHDLAVAPSVTRAGRIGLQQDTRLNRELRDVLVGAARLILMPPFVAGQFHAYLFTLVSLAAANRLAHRRGVELSE